MDTTGDPNQSAIHFSQGNENLDSETTPRYKGSSPVTAMSEFSSGSALGQVVGLTDSAGTSSATQSGNSGGGWWAGFVDLVNSTDFDIGDHTGGAGGGYDPGFAKLCDLIMGAITGQPSNIADQLGNAGNPPTSGDDDDDDDGGSEL